MEIQVDSEILNLVSSLEKDLNSAINEALTLVKTKNNCLSIYKSIL